MTGKSGILTGMEKLPGLNSTRSSINGPKLQHKKPGSRRMASSSTDIGKSTLVPRITLDGNKSGAKLPSKRTAHLIEV